MWRDSWQLWRVAQRIAFLQNNLLCRHRPKDKAAAIVRGWLILPPQAAANRQQLSALWRSHVCGGGGADHKTLRASQAALDAAVDALPPGGLTFLDAVNTVILPTALDFIDAKGRLERLRRLPLGGHLPEPLSEGETEQDGGMALTDLDETEPDTDGDAGPSHDAAFESPPLESGATEEEEAEATELEPGSTQPEPDPSTARFNGPRYTSRTA